MKKTILSTILLLLANPAFAQETATEATSFWQDKTFLMLIGGAFLLIIILIIKKVMDGKQSDNYENTDL